MKGMEIARLCRKIGGRSDSSQCGRGHREPLGLEDVEMRHADGTMGVEKLPQLAGH